MTLSLVPVKPCSAHRETPSIPSVSNRTLFFWDQSLAGWPSQQQCHMSLEAGFQVHDPLCWACPFVLSGVMCFSHGTLLRTKEGYSGRLEERDLLEGDR